MKLEEETSWVQALLMTHIRRTSADSFHGFRKKGHGSDPSNLAVHAASLGMQLEEETTMLKFHGFGCLQTERETDKHTEMFRTI